MAENRSVWGIDIGQYALKALKLQYAEGADQVFAVAFDYIPFPKILSQPDAIPEELIPQALETFLSRNDVQGDLLAISVPGHSSLVRFIQLPPVEKSKMAEIVKYEARQQIPFALEEVIWDYQPVGSGVEESGYMLDAEVGLFAMKRDQVMQHLRPFTNAKLEVELIQIAPLALYNMLSYDELGLRPGQDKAGGDEHVILLDMGCDNTTLLVSNGAKIWVRNVPIGGNHFTRALTKEMKLSFAKAEHLKCNATKSPDPRAVFQALRPVFNDYVSEIQRSIGYFSSVNRQAKISKVIGVGNGFKLAGLQKFLQQNLQYEVERPETFRALSGDAVLNAPLFQENLLTFAVPYGLALQTLQQTNIHTSLLPPEIRRARMIRQKKPWMVAAAATLLGGFALSMMGNGVTYSAVHTEAFANAEKQAQDLASKLGTFQSTYTGAVGEFEAQRNEAKNLVLGRRDLTWLELYKAINECLPRDRVEADGLALPDRHRISIDQITCEHEGDVGEWFTRLTSQQTDTLAEQDQATPPAGEGYVFTLVGKHFHHNEKDTSEMGGAYVEKALLPKLNSWQVKTEDGEYQDVGRMGISHAVLLEAPRSKVPYYPGGPPRPGTQGVEGEERRVRLLGQPGGFRPSGYGPPGFGGQSYGPGNPYAPPTPGPGGRPGAANPEVEEVWQTDFVVQFVWRPIPQDERTDTPAELPEGEAPAESDAAAQPAVYES